MRSRKRKAPKNCYWRNGTLHACIEIKGKRHRFSLHTDQVEAAESRLKIEKEKLIAIAHYGDGRKTWREAVDAWEPHAKTNLGDKTVERYLCSIAQVSPILTPATFVDEINQTLIWEIVNDRRDDGISNATIRRDLTAVASVAKFITALRWPGASNPTRDIMELVKERRDPIVLPEPADIERVIEWIGTEKEGKVAPGLLAEMARAAWLTGCRQNELVTLTWPRIDLGARQATIIGKGNKLRTIALHDAHALFARLARHNRKDTTFWHNEGEPYRNVSSRFAGYVGEVEKRSIAAGTSFRPFCFHDLRHRYAVDYLKQRRGTIYDLQQHLGHSSITTTEGYLKYLDASEVLAAKHGIAPARIEPSLRLAGNAA